MLPKYPSSLAVIGLSSPRLPPIINVISIAAEIFCGSLCASQFLTMLDDAFGILRYKTNGAGLTVVSEASHAPNLKAVVSRAVRGNRNSKVDHLESGCPSYDRVSTSNRVEFSSEEEAKAAGYRIAGNCG